MFSPNVERNWKREDVIRRQLNFCKAIKVGNFSVGEVDYEAQQVERDFGGFSLLSNTSNIIFTNGHYDPWSVDGVKDEFVKKYARENAEIYSLFLKSGAHHSELFARTSSDSKELVKVRKHIAEIVTAWINTNKITEQYELIF
eukprot:maker-scaffold_49-snap-gene-0.6-mRNA-1 protein AED:0.17 eAED:0.17 QI:1286/1/1/1/1/1/2/69/142